MPEKNMQSPISLPAWPTTAIISRKQVFDHKLPDEQHDFGDYGKHADLPNDDLAMGKISVRSNKPLTKAAL